MCPSAISRRLIAALVAALMLLPAGPAAAGRDDAADEQQLEAAYRRAMLLGYASNSPELTRTAIDTVSARLLSFDTIEGDIAGPPPSPGKEDSTSAAAGTSDGDGHQQSTGDDAAGTGTDDVREGRLLQPATPSGQAQSFRRFDMADDDTEVERYTPQSDASRDGFDAQGRRPRAGQPVTDVPDGQARVGAGGFVCPTPQVTWFTNDWGFPRSGGRTHQGNDLFAPEGSPLVAVADARVVKVQRADVGLGGLTVSYMTDDGDLVYNAHLHSVAAGLSVGDRVDAGEQIGTVGRTGNARTTPPHLHMGIYPGGGAAVSPYPYTSRACDI